MAEIDFQTVCQTALLAFSKNMLWFDGLVRRLVPSESDIPWTKAHTTGSKKRPDVMSSLTRVVPGAAARIGCFIPTTRPKCNTTACNATSGPATTAHRTITTACPARSRRESPKRPCIKSKVANSLRALASVGTSAIRYSFYSFLLIPAIRILRIIHLERLLRQE